jgi:hypothetical protein
MGHKNRYLDCSEMLRSANLQLVAEVLEQTIGPNFKSQEVPEKLTA